MSGSAMRRKRSTRQNLLFSLLALAVFGTGCANSPSVLKGNVDQLQQQQVAMQRQNQLLQANAASLDRQHQELTTVVAQLRQQIKVEQDRSRLLQTQLASTTDQLAKVRKEKETAAKQAETLTASLQRQRGVTIKPNNSLLTTLPKINLTDVKVRHDGDVIRIQLPADRLFRYGTNQFQADAGRMINAAASEILRSYPHQKIAVEGHTDSDPVQSYQYSSNTQLSLAQASAVYDLLTAQTRLRPNQLFVVGHGGSNPVASNATPLGKQENRRIELVIYPERAD